MVHGWRKAEPTSPGAATFAGASPDIADGHHGSLLAAPDDGRRPRSSSDSATPRGTPVPGPRLGFLSSSASGADTPNGRGLFGDGAGPARKLGILTEKLHSLAGHQSGGGKGTLHAALPLLQPSPTSATFPSSPTMSSNKVHTSPSKASYGRTYDSKLVTREMHRLNLTHLPSALAPALSQAPSSSALSLPAPGAMAANMASTSSSDPWGTLHVHILPLFNGEPLRIPIEDLNVLVKRHITAAASSPSKALSRLEEDTSELIGSGMRTLNAKLAEKEDAKLIGRVVEIWGFFWDQVLPYVEGALLPLQTDPLLLQLYRQPKRPSSPNRQAPKGSISSISALSPQYLDVRAVALKSFRDKVILPLAPRMKARLSMTNRQDNFQETPGYQQPRLQQMLLVLASQNRYRAPTLVSLNLNQSQKPTEGEAAVLELLRILRSPSPQFDTSAPVKPNGRARAPSFLSGGLPRDRRGRIAQKQKGTIQPISTGRINPELSDEELDGGETPRLGAPMLEPPERERERQIFLESLRNADPLSPGARASVGGWGIGIGHEESITKEKEDDEEEGLDWDQAQARKAAVVERMVGMKATTPEPTLSRRR